MKMPDIERFVRYRAFLCVFRKAVLRVTCQPDRSALSILTRERSDRKKAQSSDLRCSTGMCASFNSVQYKT